MEITIAEAAVSSLQSGASFLLRAFHVNSVKKTNCVICGRVFQKTAPKPRYVRTYQGSDCGTPMAKGPSRAERGRLLRVVFNSIEDWSDFGVQSQGLRTMDATGVIAYAAASLAGTWRWSNSKAAKIKGKMRKVNFVRAAREAKVAAAAKSRRQRPLMMK